MHFACVLLKEEPQAELYEVLLRVKPAGQVVPHT
jgi:hypothetical protein